MIDINKEKLESVLDGIDYFGYLLNDYVEEEDCKETLKRVFNRCILDTMEAFKVDKEEITKMKLSLFWK